MSELDPKAIEALTGAAKTLGLGAFATFAACWLLGKVADAFRARWANPNWAPRWKREK